MPSPFAQLVWVFEDRAGCEKQLHFWKGLKGFWVKSRKTHTELSNKLGKEQTGNVSSYASFQVAVLVGLNCRLEGWLGNLEIPQRFRKWETHRKATETLHIALAGWEAKWTCTCGRPMRTWRKAKGEADLKTALILNVLSQINTHPLARLEASQV